MANYQPVKMQKKILPIRGTKDYHGQDQLLFDQIIDLAKRHATLSAYSPIQIPIFENSNVFFRTLGETSDVVSKETYTFNDRDKASITLRPEFTAGIVRFLISNGLLQSTPLKLFTYGPLFRHERPQKARLRQFHQINFEHIGSSSFLADADIILLANSILTSLGLADDIKLELNTLGDSESRVKYRKLLHEYLSAHKNKLSENSLARLDANPLRILDSKDEGDKEICQNAPQIYETLNESSRLFFDNLRAALKDAAIDFEFNPKIVRGLDYYNHTVFEFTTNKLGAQGTVLAGGRYDGLVEAMGGQSTPAVGFAGGVERIMELLKLKEPLSPNTAKVCVIGIGEEGELKSLATCQKLRKAAISCFSDYGMKLGKKFQKADKSGADFAIVIGDDEIKANKYKLKNLHSGEEESLGLNAIIDRLMAWNPQFIQR